MALVPLTGGSFSLSALSTLAQIVGTVPATANFLYLESSAQNTRYTLNGTAPTTTTGFRLIAASAAQGVWLTRAQFTKLQAIAESAGAVLAWQFYKT